RLHLGGSAPRVGRALAPPLLLRLFRRSPARGLCRLLGLGERELLLQILCGGQHIERCHWFAPFYGAGPDRVPIGFGRREDVALISIKNRAIGGPPRRTPHHFLFSPPRSILDRSKHFPPPSVRNPPGGPPRPTTH